MIPLGRPCSLVQRVVEAGGFVERPLPHAISIMPATNSTTTNVDRAEHFDRANISVLVAHINDDAPNAVTVSASAVA